MPVQLKIYDFSLSDATHHDNVNNVIVDGLWHKPVTTEDYRAIWELYLANMARHRISPYLAQQYQQIQWTYYPSNASFSIDFTDFDIAMSHFLDDYNLGSFQILVDEHRTDYGLGSAFRLNYNGQGDKIINPAYKDTYPKLVQPIYQHILEKGWADKVYSFWIDEPALDNFASEVAYTKEGMQLIADTAPALKRMLPANTFDFPKAALFGDVDIWSPGLDAYSFHDDRNKQRQALGEKVWPYCFVRPYSPWPNNLIDLPAASPRIRQWIGEKLGWDGELYWGINYYFTVPVLGSRNPWTTPFVQDALGFKQGNGDGSLVYPPLKQYPTNTVIAGPIDSVRWENLREGIEDREYFWVLDQAIAEAGSRLGTNHPTVVAARAARAAALAPIPWPPAYPYEPEVLAAARDLVAQTIESLDIGVPIIAAQPTSKAGRTGNSEYLKVEALGWPIPAIQWQHDGTNVPGGIGARLTLANITTDMAGSYRAIATNSAGSVTSSVVSFRVIDASLPPQIIRQPDSLTRTNGGRAVFGAFASSATPMTYQWLFNNAPIAGATNLTLVLTNLTLSQGGNYSVIVSNSAGATTSSSAALLMQAPPTLQAHATAGGIQIDIDRLYAPAQIQFSTNLLSWQTLTNLPPSATTINFIDQGITNSPYRYYRVLIAP